MDERTERSKGMTLELSNWCYEGVLMKGGVLSIDRAYFAISGGRERWLYKVARKHAGGAGEGGFAVSMPTLFDKSGAQGEYRRFKFELLKLAEKNALPGYALSVEQPTSSAHGGEPSLRMRRTGALAEPMPRPGGAAGWPGRSRPSRKEFRRGNFSQSERGRGSYLLCPRPTVADPAAPPALNEFARHPVGADSNCVAPCGTARPILHACRSRPA